MKSPDESGRVDPSVSALKAEDGAPAGPRFEEALERLEELVEELESGELALEDSIARFEEGQRLLRVCNELLEGAELRVREVLRRSDGTLVARDLDLEENEGG